MPPRKKPKTEVKPTEDDPALLEESSRQRLTQKAQGGGLLRSDATSLGREGVLPAALRKADGADILKRNARRTKKYLLVFPGDFVAPAGSTVGTLRGLDSRTPCLDVTLEEGVLRFRGALVFPKNALITIRGRAGGKVTIEDVFETLLVFAEWAWLGDMSANPGAVPVPFPDALRKCVETDPAFKAARIQPALRFPKPGSTKKAKKTSPKIEVLDSESVESVASKEDVLVLDDDEDDDFAVGSTQDSAPVSKRKMPARERRMSKSFTSIFADAEEEDEVEEEEANENDNDTDFKQEDTEMNDVGSTRTSSKKQSKISFPLSKDDDDDSDDEDYL